MTVDAAADRDGSGWIALHYAIAYHAPTRLLERLLLAHPDGARQRAGAGPLARLPLQLALTRGASADTVSSLLAAYPAAARDDADTDVPDNSHSRVQPRRSSVLMAAVLADDSTLVRMLLEAQADPNSRSDRPPHASCAMVAAERRNRAVLYQLLASGADAFARDDDGRSVLEVIPKRAPRLVHEEEQAVSVSDTSSDCSMPIVEQRQEEDSDKEHGTARESDDDYLDDYDDELRAAHGRVSGRRGGITLEEAHKAATMAVALSGAVQTDSESREQQLRHNSSSDLLSDEEDARKLAQMKRSRTARRRAIHTADRSAGAEATAAATAQVALVVARKAAEHAQEQKDAIQEDPIVSMVLRAMEAQHQIELTASEMITLYDASPIFDGDESGLPDSEDGVGSEVGWRGGWGVSWGFTSGAWSKDSPYYEQTPLAVSEPDIQPEHAKSEQTGDEESDDAIIPFHTPLRGASPGGGLAGHMVDPSGVLPAAPGAIAGGVAQVLGQHAVVEMREEVAGLRTQLAQAMAGIEQLTRLLLSQTAQSTAVGDKAPTTTTEVTEGVVTSGVASRVSRIALDSPAALPTAAAFGPPLLLRGAVSAATFAPPGDSCHYTDGRLVSIAARGGKATRPIRRRNAARAWRSCYASLHASVATSDAFAIDVEKGAPLARLVLTAEAVSLSQGAALAAAGYGLDLCQYEMAANGGVSDRIAGTDPNHDLQSTEYIELSPVNSQRGTDGNVGPVVLAFFERDDWLYWARAIDAAMSVVRPEGPVWRRQAIMQAAAVQTEAIGFEVETEPRGDQDAAHRTEPVQKEEKFGHADFGVEPEVGSPPTESSSSRAEKKQEPLPMHTALDPRVSTDGAAAPLPDAASLSQQEFQARAVQSELQTQPFIEHPQQPPSQPEPEPETEREKPEREDIQPQAHPASKLRLQPQLGTPTDGPEQRMRSLEERLAQARAARAARKR